jgi:uncharacterized protein (DUF362 family)
VSPKSRRQVLVAGAAVAAGGCFPDVGGHWPVLSDACRDTDTLAPPVDPSPVAEIQSDDAVTVDAASGHTTLNDAPIRAMLDAALLALVPSGSAWATLLPGVTADARVGIKVNALNELCPTTLPLVKALVDSLVDGLSLSRDRIVVWDRRVDELARVGFTDAAVGAKVIGTWASVTDQSGPGYGEPTCGVVAGKAPRLSRILTDLTDVTLNFPVLKTHAICGVTGALKNIYGIIDNPGDYHANINTSLPELYRLPPIRKALRFHLLDALVAVTTGGTSSPADTVPKRLLASVDPLALDRRALALADQLRADKQLGLAPVDRSVMGWMENAQALGLGSLDYLLKA